MLHRSAAAPMPLLCHTQGAGIPGTVRPPSLSATKKETQLTHEHVDSPTLLQGSVQDSEVLLCNRRRSCMGTAGRR